MRIAILTILTALHMCSCSKKTDYPTTTAVTNPVDTIKPKPNGQPYTYLALGDSYTIGQSVDPKDAYPNQLVTQITGDGFAIDPATILATTGWTTNDLINAINTSDLPGKQYDFVTLLIGVNDQYQGLSQDQYRINFEQLLNTALKFAGNNKDHVFVISIPDWGVTPFAGGDDARIGPLIDQFNAINLEISLKYQVHYINVTPISRLAAKDLSLIAADGLHPSGKMYGMWVDLLKPVVEGELRK